MASRTQCRPDVVITLLSTNNGPALDHIICERSVEWVLARLDAWFAELVFAARRALHGASCRVAPSHCISGERYLRLDIHFHYGRPFAFIVSSGRRVRGADRHSFIPLFFTFKFAKVLVSIALDQAPTKFHFRSIQ
jgi:hypothetical protein